MRRTAWSKAAGFLGAGALSLVVCLTFSAQPAGATPTLVRTDEFTFSNGTNDVTCTITSQLMFPYFEDTDRAMASTTVSGAAGCADSRAIVRFDYREPDGTEHFEVQSAGAGGVVQAEVEPVAEVSTKHLASFGNCVGVCTSPVYNLGPATK